MKTGVTGPPTRQAAKPGSRGAASHAATDSDTVEGMDSAVALERSPQSAFRIAAG